MSNDLKDISQIQRNLSLKTKQLMEQIEKIDHKGLSKFLLPQLKDIQADHNVIENYFKVAMWLEQSKDQ